MKMWHAAQVARAREDPGKGCYWSLNPLSLHQARPHQALERRRRGLSLVLGELSPALRPVMPLNILLGFISIRVSSKQNEKSV